MNEKVDDLKAVLHAYSVQPFYIENETEKLYKVQDGQQQFALKQSQLSPDDMAMWENVYQEAYTQNLHTILPVFLTREGNIYEIYEGTVYYLSPWRGNALSSFDKYTIGNFYRHLGHIHVKTKRTRTVDTDSFVQNFRGYQKQCEALQKKLLFFVEQFEAKHYMSPFELLVCTHFRDIDFSLQESNRRIDQLINEQEQQEQWNYSLCHGNLNSSHVIVSPEQMYLINWDKARYEYAPFDLSQFYKSETVHYDAPVDLFLDEFDSYMNENKLTNKELYILIIQVLDPAPYIQLVEEHDQSSKTMIDQIIPLQHIFRRILFGLRLSAYVEKEYDTLDLDDLES